MKHVLIIEPDSSLRKTYSTALEKAGFSVAGTADAQKAIGLCETRAPDVIVLELQLRAHSGVEFLHELRSYTEWQSIPVILHTFVPFTQLAGFKNAFKTLKITDYAFKPETSLKKLVALVEDGVLVKL